jgi:DNA-binding NarL/FixJ family response regulator
MIRVALADDQELVRAGFAALLDAEDDIEIVGEAADGEQAVKLAAAATPDVLLMDIRMPRLDGIEATRRIAALPRLGGVRVVILTTFELDEYVFEGLRAGAYGFLVKDTDAAELIRAVRVVAAGEALQRRDLPQDLRQPVDREDARSPGNDQAPRQGPGPARRVRLPGRPGPARLGGLTGRPVRGPRPAPGGTSLRAKPRST